MTRETFSMITIMAFGFAAGCDSAESDDPFVGGRFAVTATIFQPDGETSLVGLVDDPGVPAELDPARAVEVGGAAAIFGLDGTAVFSLGSSDSPTLTRYEVKPDGELVQRREVMSLAPYGITSGFKRPELVPFVSAAKAYWIDDVSLQVVVWDPSEMTLTSSFSLSSAEREGLFLEVGEAVVRQDGSVVVSVNYRQEDEGEAGQAVAILIDSANDSVTGVVTDDRCGGTLDIAAQDDGTLYFASNAFAASLHALQRPQGYPSPCILRIQAGETRFDPEFHVAIPDLTDGHSGGNLVMGVDGHAYVLALHTELLDAAIGPETDLFAPWESTAWRWWRVDTGFATPGVLLEEAPIRSGASRVLRAGGREFIAHANIETGTSTLLVPTADGDLQPGLVVNGYPYGLIALR